MSLMRSNFHLQLLEEYFIFHYCYFLLITRRAVIFWFLVTLHLKCSGLLPVLHNCHISKLKHDEALPHAGGELIPDTFTVNEPDNYYQEVCSVLKMYLTYILKVHLKVDFCSFGNTPTAAATRCTMCL